MSGLPRWGTILCVAAAVALLLAAPAQADHVAELATAEKNYRSALAAERTAKEKADTALAAVTKARTDAEAPNARWDRARAAIDQARRELLALLEERAQSQIKVAEVADRARAARRVYDDARPIYEVRGRTERLADIPEWKAIEKRAADTNTEFQRVSREEQPRQQGIDRRIDAKQAEARRLVEAADAVVTMAVADPAGAWLAAALQADLARKAHLDAQATVVRTFDAYAARLGTTRPPFLEAVSASVGNQPLYDGVWRRDPTVENPNETRRSDIRAVLNPLASSIQQREAEREEMHRERLAISGPLHSMSIAIAAAEKRAADANYDKIFYTALAEAAGTLVEAVVTGGVSVGIRAAEKAAEVAIEKAAEKALARRAGQAIAAGEAEAVASMRRLAMQSTRALSEDAARFAKELEELAVEAATRRAMRTGEALTTATAGARREVQQALRSMRSADPAVREEATLQAISLFGTKVREAVTAVGIAHESKTGSAALASLLDSGSSARDMGGVVLGDVIEQGMARGTTYALAVAPAATGAGIDAVRAAAAANASNWQAVRSGSVAFLRGGVKLKEFKEAAIGSARGNLVTVGTTLVKTAITKYFADQQYAAANLAAELSMRWDIEYAILAKLLDGDRALAGPLNEARELQAELRTYLALVEGPRKLEPTDGETDVAPDATIALTLRFSTEVATPTATLSGVALELKPSGAPASAAAVWTASIARRSLPADAASAQLVVSLAASAEMPLDADPATPARPDPRVPLRTEGGRAVVSWLQLDGGNDSHHTLLLRDPWRGLWARGASRIRIEREGAALTGRLEVAGEPGRSERGFEQGTVVLRGMVSNHRQAQLDLLARYDGEWRQRCSGAAPGYWARGDYTLDAASVRLTGTWEDRQLDDSCRVVEAVQQRDTLERVGTAR